MSDAVTTRLKVLPVIRDENDGVLLCKMPSDRGDFPGQWGLPGAGVEPGERIEEALRREIFEELGVSLVSAKPLFSKYGMHEKTFAGEVKRLIYMVFPLYDWRIDTSQPIRLNSEFCQYTWARPSTLTTLDLNSATKETFASIGLL
jgi:nucleoside triphosphatase